MTKYSLWSHYFKYNQWQPDQLCPPDPPSLSLLTRDLIAPSLQQFQLGEGSEGIGLLRRAHDFELSTGAAGLAATIEFFIREEQRHAAVLGLYLDREGIPRSTHHWSDSWFRKIRNLAGFELMVTVLTTAELIAIPFYTALHDATPCPILRRICRRILLDEALHLEFQADNIALCASRRGDLGKMFTIHGHFIAITGTVALVYLLHRRLFRAARMSALRFWAMAIKAHQPILSRLTETQQEPKLEARAILR